MLLLIYHVPLRPLSLPVQHKALSRIRQIKSIASMYRNLLVRRYAPSFQKRTIRRPHIPEVHLPSPEIKFTVHTADAFCSCRINQLVFRSISAKAETPSGFHCKSLSRKYTCHSLQSVATVFQWFWHRARVAVAAQTQPAFFEKQSPTQR